MTKEEIIKACEKYDNDKLNRLLVWLITITLADGDDEARRNVADAIETVKEVIKERGEGEKGNDDEECKDN